MARQDDLMHVYTANFLSVTCEINTCEINTKQPLDNADYDNDSDANADTDAAEDTEDDNFMHVTPTSCRRQSEAMPKTKGIRTRKRRQIMSNDKRLQQRRVKPKNEIPGPLTNCCSATNCCSTCGK